MLLINFGKKKKINTIYWTYVNFHKFILVSRVWPESECFFFSFSSDKNENENENEKVGKKRAQIERSKKEKFGNEFNQYIWNNI